MKHNLCKGKLKKSGSVRDQGVSCLINSYHRIEKFQDYKCIECGEETGYNINEVQSYKDRNIFKCGKRIFTKQESK